MIETKHESLVSNTLESRPRLRDFWLFESVKTFLTGHGDAPVEKDCRYREMIVKTLSRLLRYSTVHQRVFQYKHVIGRTVKILDLTLKSEKNNISSNDQFFSSLKDVGSGGGILSERLARLGANVTGIDPVQV